MKSANGYGGKHKLLTLEQIAAYFPEGLARHNPRGLLVEYLQYECLDSLYKIRGSEQLSFMGGTAIHFIYQSQRFSEDLDFDNFGLDFHHFQTLIERLCYELKVKGFQVEVRFTHKEKAFHAYLKFLELLARYDLSGHPEEKILVKLDVQKKKNWIIPEIKTLNKFGIFRAISVNSASVLLAQKLVAMLTCKRERGRDFYDASFLSGLAKPDYEYLARATGFSSVQFQAKLLDRCSQFNYKALAEDVDPFLFDREQKQRVLTFPENISRILGIVS